MFARNIVKCNQNLYCLRKSLCGVFTIRQNKGDWYGLWKLGILSTVLVVIDLNVQAQPVITTQPVSLTNWAGGNASFSVAVNGNGPFSYQWQFNGTNLNQINTITTVAGTGRQAGFSGDGGPATNAVMLQPSGVATDGAGDIFIADQGNSRIRKVNTNGIINTIAGGGSSFGDGGPATNAGLNLVAYYIMSGTLYIVPSGIAVDPHGNVYIADSGNSRIRKVDTNGFINTIAGTNNYGFSGDGGLAVNAKLKSPSGMAVDSSGNIYFSDEGNDVIRKVDVNGIITTIAGNGSIGYSGDGGAATNASFNHPYGLAVDGSGNVFIADEGNNVIRKVGVNGIITTLAGNGSAGYAGDGGVATNASLSQPYGVSVDAYDDVFIADYANTRIRMVGPNETITTVAGSGIGGNTGDGGVATNADLFEPVGVGLDAIGNLFIVMDYYCAIRKVAFGRFPNLQLNNVTATNAGDYAVIINSPYGSVTSSIVTLSVFFITSQPTNQTMILGSNYIFTITANGTSPLNYQWQLNGTNINGATNAILTLTNVQFEDEGSYNVVVGNNYGSTTSSNALLMSLATALNAPGLVWSNSGASSWSPETTTTHDGLVAVQSGSAGFGQQSMLQTTISGPGTLSFWWRISSFGSLSFSINGATQGSIMFNTGWQQKTFYLGAGPQTLVWTYSGGPFPFGANAAWLDQIGFIPGGTAPIITSAPVNRSVIMNANTTFIIGAVGTPPLSYQWQFNQTDMANQTNATLTLLDAQPTSSGNYCVVITNNFGKVNTNATLFVQAFAMDTSSTNLLLTMTGFQMQIDGVLTTNPVIIFASTDLVSWLPIYTNPATTGSIQFLDFDATNIPARFYRSQE
jgi:hypothetical protein